MNKNLHKPTSNTRDEFYTTAETAARLFYYIYASEFNGKIVYCNCDGPESEIYKYLKTNFEQFKLKRLIATKYVKDGNGILTLFDGKEETMSYLSSDGSYCSNECTDILKQCDIVATNPPFSKLNDFIPYVVDKYKKDCVLIVNLMSLMYSKIYKMSLQGKFNCCCHFCGGGKFKTIEGSIASVQVIGITTLNVSNIGTKRLPKKTFNELQQAGKINYDDYTHRVEVEYIRNIPIDYSGEMLVPMTILCLKSIKDQFDILGLADKCAVNGKNRFYRIIIKKKMA